MKKHPEECKEHLLLWWTKYRFWCSLFPFVLYWRRQCKGTRESSINDVWWPGKKKWRGNTLQHSSVYSKVWTNTIGYNIEQLLKMCKIGQAWKKVWVAGGNFASLNYNFRHKHICCLSHWQESIIWKRKIHGHGQKFNYTLYNLCASLLTELVFL